MEIGVLATSPTSVGTGSVRLVWPFLSFAKNNGVEIATIAGRLGLTPHQLEDPDTRVSQKLLAELLNDAVACFGGRDLGLIAAQAVDGLHLGIGDYIARTRATLADAIAGTDRYLPLLIDGAGHAIEHRSDRAISRFWFDPRLVIHDAAYEFVIAVWTLWTRRITGFADYAPLSVHFMHARPASITRHERVFRCPIYFGSTSTMVVVSAKDLALRLPSVEPVLGGLLERQAATMLANLSQSDDLAADVRAMLGAQSDLSALRLTQIARRFGMSVRSLTRKLSYEGTSFGQLLDEAREHIARRELSHGSATIVEIADRLGFASAQSFNRAFKRWTGITPGRARRQARTQRRFLRAPTRKP